MSALTIIINAVVFQLAWFAALYGGILDQIWLAVLPASAAVIWHFYQMGPAFRSELALVFGVLILGFLVESTFIGIGAITYVGTPILGFGPPVWILAMWLAFATLPHGCLNWLKSQIILQFVLGGLSGPLSYVAGVKLGAASLNEPVFLALAIIGLGWALALPAIFWLANRLKALF